MDVGVFETHPRFLRYYGCKNDSRLHLLASLERTLHSCLGQNWHRTWLGPAANRVSPYRAGLEKEAGGVSIIAFVSSKWSVHVVSS